ncbi:E4 ORF2 [Mastadenovirus eidoli]|uniref:E4 ORF2 n=1 Tax=Eidolon helvum adenovirus TaxID=2039267 RepID=A0A348FKI1_9ADEN|nr:E4 ORF2 [Eidolon helvum adenovirus]BBF72848.1 E4 ORF2 [Eidolon helvum adenovirus]
MEFSLMFRIEISGSVYKFFNNATFKPDLSSLETEIHLCLYRYLNDRFPAGVQSFAGLSLNRQSQESIIYTLSFAFRDKSYKEVFNTGFRYMLASLLKHSILSLFRFSAFDCGYKYNKLEVETEVGVFPETNLFRL